MASFSDELEEASGESTTALKLGGLVLKDKQKAGLYYLEKARLFMHFADGVWKITYISTFSFCCAPP